MPPPPPPPPKKPAPPFCAWRPSSALVAGVFALAHALGGALLFAAASGRPLAEAFAPSALLAQLRALRWDAQLDLLLTNAACALLTLATSAACRLAPLCCFARAPSGALVRAAATGAASLGALFGLVKILAAPAASDDFWGAATLLFLAATVDAFLLDRVVVATRGWALEAAAKKAGVTAAAAARAAAAAAAADPEEEASAAEAAAKAKAGRASLARLLALSRPDVRYIAQGFVFLCVAAVASTVLPHYTGALIDDVIAEDSVAFSRDMQLLLSFSIIVGIFTGLRGWSFMIAIARLKVRLRDRLFRALVSQEMGFYDGTSTGELTSRLSTDTTSVGDQVSLNVNVFLRSLISAVGALIFMFSLSWKLTLLSFCTVPPIIVVAQVYGRFVQKLSRRAQTSLAECNRIAEEALSSMLTVRAFAGEQLEADLHAQKLADFYENNRSQANAYALYAMVTTFLPSAVTVAVLWGRQQARACGNLLERQPRLLPAVPDDACWRLLVAHRHLVGPAGRYRRRDKDLCHHRSGAQG